jgi:hypothetical protein
MIEKKEEINTDWSNVLFHPEIIHNDWISNFENIKGHLIISSFRDAYRTLLDAISLADKWPDHRKSALITLADGFASLICVVNLLNFGFVIESCLVIRYYLEVLGLSYGCFYDSSLYDQWKNNPNKKYANTFTKKGLTLLSGRNEGFKNLWDTFSKISHFAYNSSGTTFLDYDSIAISGVHSKERDNFNKTIILATDSLIRITGKIITNDYLMSEEEIKIVEGK